MDGANPRLASTARSKRKSLGLSLREVCEQAREEGHRIDPAYLSRLERGLVTWSARMVDIVACGLGITSADLLQHAASAIDGGEKSQSHMVGAPEAERKFAKTG